MARCSKMSFFCKPSRERAWKVEKILYLLSFACALTIGEGYNFDTDNIKLFNDPKSFASLRPSYFGFSTALYAGSDGNNFADASILVGAPRANVSAIRGVLEPGTVYKCGIYDDTCVEWNLDPTPNTWRMAQSRQLKNNAWIGASIEVEDNRMTRPLVVWPQLEQRWPKTVHLPYRFFVQRPLMVTGPRWKNNMTTAWYMNGICYWSTVQNGETFGRKVEKRLIPLLDKNEQVMYEQKVPVSKYAMGQSGFSLHLYSDNEQSDILIGSPGLYNGRGAPLLLRGSIPAIIPKFEDVQSMPNSIYTGYSVSSGFYFRRSERCYAAGAPRGADMKGQVLIFDFDGTALHVKKTIDGTQYGEYFGASLAFCDINNDRKDEIVVGAPFWSSYLEEGRVYVYSSEFKMQILEGKVAGARFGSVVTCLGDIDYDGYADIAVGAPYEDEHGAIYIYNGNSMGLNTTYSQRITGKSISEEIRGFGSAISEPRDVDRNAYSDIAVGAYLSGHVALLRSQPVITIRVNVNYKGAGKLDSDATFFEVTVCSYYSGSHVPERLTLERILKVDLLEGRAFVDGDRNMTGVYADRKVLNLGTSSCDDMRINLVKGIKDRNVIDPIEVRASLAMVDEVENANNRVLRKLVVNKVLSKTEDSKSLAFAVDCGADNVCTSNLQLIAEFENGARHTIGSESNVRLNVRLVNTEEPAYNAEAYVFIPSPVILASIPKDCSDERLPSGDIEVTCPLGNPFKGNANLPFELEMDNVPIGSDHLGFMAKVSTQNINVNPKDTLNFTIYFDMDVTISIAGKGEQESSSYLNEDHGHLLESTRFQHIYQVQKFGLSPIEESVVTVWVPTHWNNDENAAEIVSVNQTFGLLEGQEFSCNVSSPINGEEIVAGTKTSEEPSIQENMADTQEDFPIALANTAEDSKLSLPPEERALYLNCTNNAVKCTQISCRLGRIANSRTVAKLTITLDLHLKNLESEMEGRDIIFFVSNGSVTVTKPEGIIQGDESKPTSTAVGTTFVGTPVDKKIATWIIVVSALLGILLLVLLTLGLVRLGFFHRKKKEQLEALKAENDKSHGLVLETTSSREVLDKD